jgi:transcriptional regulator with XRE-family HTH domain
MMARSFNELRKIMTPERQAANAARAKEILAEMPLRQLRYALEQSQQSIAESLGTTQSEVSKLERRTDAYISTVRRYVEALGGHLDLIARFPDGDYRITQFSEVLDSVGSRRRGSRRRRETTAGSSRSRRR